MFSKSFVAVCCLAAAQRCAADTLLSSIHDNFIVPALTEAGLLSDYEVSVESISLMDASSGIEVVSLHNGRPFDVIAMLHWEEEVYNINSTNTLLWEMFVDGVAEDTGSINLIEVR